MKKPVRITQYADDAILFLNSREELCSVLNVINEFEMFLRWFFANYKVIIMFTTSKFRCDVDCADLHTTYDVLCHTPHTVIKMGIVEICLPEQSNLTPFKCLSYGVGQQRHTEWTKTLLTNIK